MQRESRTIPIVFVNVSDPIGSGFVASLARPGGNLTGLLLYEEGIIGKWLAMLKEIAPQLARVALIANPKSTPTTISCVPPRRQRLARDRAGPQSHRERRRHRARHRVASRVYRTVAWSYCRIPRLSSIAISIIALAARHRLPAVYAFRFFVAAGGLMSYGTDIIATVSSRPPPMSTASCEGEKPADLPVQAPTKYETVLNLKTAKSLGLEVPPSLLVRADEVIE